MSRMIIECRDGVGELCALDAVRHVIAAGRISNNNKQYCYHTTFKSGEYVATDLNKCSDCFIVGKELR